MSQLWAKEPWKHGTEQEGSPDLIVGNDGLWIADMMNRAHPECLPNRDRILDCVNALEGVPTEMLTAPDIHQTIARAFDPDYAGLNPAAYRECVEALCTVEKFLTPLEADTPDSLSRVVNVVKHALAHAEKMP